MMKNRIKLAKALLKFNDYVTADNITITTEGNLEVGKEVYTTDEQGEIIPLGNGEYDVEGVTIIVEGGVITEIKEQEVEQPEETTTIEEEVVLEEQPEETTNTEVEELKAKIAELEAENEALKLRIAELEAELEEAKKPTADPIENDFAKQEKENKQEKGKIDFTKYIKRNNK